MRNLIIIFLALPVLSLAQTAKVNHFAIAKGATINMNEPTEDWEILLQHLEAPKPGVSGERAELMEKKKWVMERYPAQTSESPRAAAGNAPGLGLNFEGNSFNGVPNDNDMAISNDGNIVSVTNSRIHMYNSSTEQQLLFRSLGNIADTLDLSGSKFDPKVVYDPNNNRFVMVFLNGFTWQTSWIVVGFSRTSDPTGDWNMYALPGNPLENETWADYPVIGISGKDLFIGINTFTNGSSNNSGFTETCLWQVGLKEGYLGFELITNYYNDILPQSKKIFNITPMSPADASTSEDMFLLSNRNTSAENDSIFVLHVTGRVSDPNTELEVRTIQADQPYILPVPAKQAGNHWFDTNDSRILGGYTLNGRIYFVQSCTDPATGTSAIYHGVIDNAAEAPTMVSRIYSEPNLYLGYPNISWTGLSANDEQSIITFNHTSETEFAGFSAIHVNGDLERSDRVQIKEGLGFVNVMNDTLERWGDYSGSQRVYNQPGKVWAAGSFGSAAHGHGTWLAELTTPDLSTGIQNLSKDAEQALVFPNPVTSGLQVEFELEKATLLRLELVDIEGRTVKLILEDRIKAGKNRLSFNADFLSSGTYFLNAYDNQKLVFSNKLIKQ